MFLKFFVATLVFSCSLVHAGVSLQAVAGTKNHTVKISGTVLKEDLVKFEQVLDEVERKRRKLHMNAIQLDVGGGDPEIAQSMGRLIRAKKLNTFLAPNDRCVSACVYLAIAGMDRMIYGSILLHRLMLINDHLSEDSIKQAIKEHRKEATEYIAEMDGSVLLAEAIHFTPNWGLRRLTKDEVQHWGIFGADPVHEAIMFQRGAQATGLSKAKFNAAYVDALEECRRAQYEFKSLALDCAIDRIKRRPPKKQ
jgi:hypothetical protein